MTRKEITIKLILTDDDVKTIITKVGLDSDSIHDNLEIIGALQNLLAQQQNNFILADKSKFKFEEDDK